MLLIKNILKFITPIIINKYVIVFLIFAIFVVFFDDHNLIHRWETERKIKELEKEYDYFQHQIKVDKNKMELLKTSDEYLEKVAREQYHMKSKEEEIYIIKQK